MLESIFELLTGFGLAVPAPAGQSLTGKVASISYYGQNKMRLGGGLDQKLSDARASVKWEGMPAGLITADGKVYQIIGGLAANNNAKIIDYLGKTVTITGDVTEKHGMLTISADSLQ